jgi:hypothetical protein
VSWAIILGLKMVLPAGFMHGPSPLGQFSTRIPVGHVPARRCVSKLAKLKYIARFQSKVGTVLIGRETMCGVILRGDEY